ncbi:MAG: N-acetylglucosamine-6-phosphate deacetylase [Alphaproteobacteria bacterium]|nr:N-acetylglucosamine-6-phosphate deacetylase [Alphaproteobacteria bacterium]
MSEQRRVGRILTSEGWVSGALVHDTHVLAIEAGEEAGEDAGEDAPRIIPGFVDLHVPGGGGADIMEAGDAVRTVARLHARHGTTSFLPATVTASREDLEAALAAVDAAREDRGDGEARVLGAHMEGPYINPERLGAQPPHARDPEPDFVQEVCEAGVVKLVTLAPEVAGGMDAIRAFAAAGIAVQIGHTDTDYETACAALDAGATGFTHLFNAMSPLHHRAPGVTGAALARSEYAAIIPDGVHVADGALLAALRAVPRLFAVTDATAAAGMPDGAYPLGEHTVTKRGDSVFLGEDTLAGSALTMDAAFVRLRALGLEVDDVSRRLSTYPADFIGRRDRGRIAPGAWADFVILDPDERIAAVVVEGEEIALS